MPAERLARAGWALAVAGLTLNLLLVVSHLLRTPWNSDFKIFYAAAETGRDGGWATIYQQPHIFALEAVIGPPSYLPFLNPPPLAWLAAPFVLLDFRTAFWLWSLTLIAILAATVWLARPALTGGRLSWGLAAAAWAFPVIFGVLEGQPVALSALGVVAAWRLARDHRDTLAGAALGLTLLKPHTAWLIPLVFAAAGRPRVLGGYLLAALPVTALSALSLGESGILDFIHAVLFNTSAYPPPGYIFPAHLPRPLAFAAEALAAALALLAAFWLRGRATPALLLAVGTVGSLLATPHINLQDLALLVIGGWLLWPEMRTRGGRALLGCVYLAVFITPASALLVLPAECVWLLATLERARAEAFPPRLPAEAAR